MAAEEAAAATVPVFSGISDMVFIGIFIILGMIVIFLMIREVRLMKTANRKVELDLEKDKLKLLQQHEAAKFFPFTRFSPEQIAEIRSVEDEIRTIETNNFAKENLLDKRLTKLEDIVKAKKLDGMLENLSTQEKKVK
ncbi:hypothetical protein [Methanoregula sp. UBA64]|uniref:hypothetical protein n=1 Tax=Methanoregula sp. UBA64 TaxID=1915554 RepID=UPI0025F55D37|nr:hypothetical protein [Methanoregula sp. UBA64]